MKCNVVSNARSSKRRLVLQKIEEQAFAVDIVWPGKKNSAGKHKQWMGNTLFFMCLIKQTGDPYI